MIVETRRIQAAWFCMTDTDRFRRACQDRKSWQGITLDMTVDHGQTQQDGGWRALVLRWLALPVARLNDPKNYLHGPRAALMEVAMKMHERIPPPKLEPVPFVRNFQIHHSATSITCREHCHSTLFIT